MQAAYVGLVVLAILLVWVAVLNAIERKRNTGWRRRDAAVSVELAARAAEIIRLRDQLGDVEALKAQNRRLDGILDRTNARVLEQNAELEYFRQIVGIVRLP